MRNRSFGILLGIGIVLLVLGAIAVGHYHGPHSTCGSAHPLAAAVCTKVKRRFILGFVVAALGLVAVVAAVTEKVRR